MSKIIVGYKNRIQHETMFQDTWIPAIKQWGSNSITLLFAESNNLFLIEANF